MLVGDAITAERHCVQMVVQDTVIVWLKILANVMPVGKVLIVIPQFVQMVV